jgi:hypothetical protein
MAVIQNAINANATTPLTPLDGGTGVSNPTIHGVLIAEGSSAFTPIVLTAGQVLIGTTASDPVGATLTAGAGISISSVSGAITITNNSASTTWIDQLSTPVTMTTRTGYTSDAGASLITFTLPTSAAIGDTIEIQGKGSGLFVIAQAASQQIFMGNVSTTPGIVGSLASTLQYDYIRLKALTTGATSTWSVCGSQGTFNLT